MGRDAFFLTIEGIDGVGKSTHASLLAEYLSKEKNLVVLRTKEPGDNTDILNMLRDILLSPRFHIDKFCELFLYLAARIEHLQKVIIPAMNQCDIIICERYIDSTLAYQGYAQGIDIELIDKLNNLSINGILPRLTILLDSEDIELCLKRIKEKKDRIEAQPLEFHQRVRQGYLELSKKYPDRIKIIKVDNLDIISTQKIIRDYVSKLLSV